MYRQKQGFPGGMVGNPMMQMGMNGMPNVMNNMGLGGIVGG